MYSQEKADAICERLERGESLRQAAKAVGMLPSTILGWTKYNKAFSEQYARAREIGYLLLADEILEISDDASLDVTQTEDGRVIVDQERIARSRLRVDSRKWMLSKMLPKIYGEKIEATHEVGESVQRIVRELVRAPRTADSDR
jgi:hypothetical protein